MSQGGNQVGLFTLPHLGIRDEIGLGRRRWSSACFWPSVGAIWHRQIEARTTSAAEDHGAFDDIPELPNVAWPAIPDELLDLLV